MPTYQRAEALTDVLLELPGVLKPYLKMLRKMWHEQYFGGAAHHDPAVQAMRDGIRYACERVLNEMLEMRPEDVREHLIAGRL